MGKAAKRRSGKRVFGDYWRKNEIRIIFPCVEKMSK